MERRNDFEIYREQIPSMPEDFAEWAFSQFDGAYNFYKGNITLADDYGDERELKNAVWCPVCRRWDESKVKIKSGYGYTCKVCGSKGSVFLANKKITPTCDYQTMWLGQRLQNKVFVLRSFVVALVQRTPVLSYEDQYEIIWKEKRRLYIGSSWWGVEYNNFNWNTRQNFWASSGADSTNISGPVHPDTYENIKGTWAEYACIDIARDQELFESEPNIRGGYGRGPYMPAGVSIFNFLQTYAKDRKVEMLMKLGMYQIVENKVLGQSALFNYRAKNPYDYLRVYKSRIDDLRDHQGGFTYLRAYQLERQMKGHWSDEEVEVIRLNYHHMEDIKDILEYMSLKQFANRISTYCKRNNRTPQECCSIYFDYFKAKKALGYDMSNTIYQYGYRMYFACPHWRTC